MDINAVTDPAVFTRQFKGIGIGVARKIIDSGPYTSMDQLRRVRGLGQSKIESLKNVFVAGPATADAGTAAVAAPPSKSSTGRTPKAATTKKRKKTKASKSSKATGEGGTSSASKAKAAAAKAGRGRGGRGRPKGSVVTRVGPGAGTAATSKAASKAAAARSKAASGGSGKAANGGNGKEAGGDSPGSGGTAQTPAEAALASSARGVARGAGTHSAIGSPSMAGQRPGLTAPLGSLHHDLAGTGAQSHSAPSTPTSELLKEFTTRQFRLHQTLNHLNQSPLPSPATHNMLTSPSGGYAQDLTKKRKRGGSGSPIETGSAVSLSPLMFDGDASMLSSLDPTGVPSPHIHPALHSVIPSPSAGPVTSRGSPSSSTPLGLVLPPPANLAAPEAKPYFTDPVDDWHSEPLLPRSASNPSSSSPQPLGSSAVSSAASGSHASVLSPSLILGSSSAVPTITASSIDAFASYDLLKSQPSEAIFLPDPLAVYDDDPTFAPLAKRAKL
ncbi:uncharacterized protein AMSG_09368 [Thecamonas trahens ATCC 50062]|uniref:Helix-hairpin-helix domain-containing protein n=1 Tax=Thecamonas trahens ATCC 50062 TaxID=461836 RepID=A0A0L0DM27_THETB|nr:hypothetical protein AMSG_09368 [Thecamonas trahens ATCC 50062]KNC53071.1 hypothetical protein AMSG_09368 [Thecamonas trahens ATCC 50062]|eukprot:XP_013754746.1 hypothetical protein AMSG_09368 [Thecamonas trahens ATCC 50062]